MGIFADLKKKRTSPLLLSAQRGVGLAAGATVTLACGVLRGAVGGIFTVKVRVMTSNGSLIMWVPREGLGYE